MTTAAGTRLAIATAGLALTGCDGTTGYDLVTFYAAASGVPHGAPGGEYAFTNDQGFEVTLTTATLVVGAVYLDQTVPTAGEGAEPCTLPGTYVGEVRGGVHADLLSAELQTFDVTGDGSTIPAALGQVWLTGDGDVNDPNDETTILTVEGSASKGGETFPFGGQITLDASCFGAPPSATPGIDPICQAQIVTPIPTNIVLAEGGTLALRVDAAALFALVDFSALPSVGGSPPSYAFSGCAGSDPPSIALFTNLTSAAPYRFEWQPASR